MRCGGRAGSPSLGLKGKKQKVQPQHSPLGHTHRSPLSCPSFFPLYLFQNQQTALHSYFITIDSRSKPHPSWFRQTTFLILLSKSSRWGRNQLGGGSLPLPPRPTLALRLLQWTDTWHRCAALELGQKSPDRIGRGFLRRCRGGGAPRPMPPTHGHSPC